MYVYVRLFCAIKGAHMEMRDEHMYSLEIKGLGFRV